MREIAEKTAIGCAPGFASFIYSCKGWLPVVISSAIRGRMSAAGEGRAPASVNEVTRLLQAWGTGDQAALQQLMPFVYNELHRLAHHYMAAEQSGQTLQTTALVHEVYLRLVDVKKIDWQSRAHF